MVQVYKRTRVFSRKCTKITDKNQVLSLASAVPEGERQKLQFTEHDLKTERKS